MSRRPSINIPNKPEEEITNNMASVLRSLFPKGDKIDINSGVISIANYMNSLKDKKLAEESQDKDEVIEGLKQELEKCEEAKDDLKARLTVSESMHDKVSAENVQLGKTIETYKFQLLSKNTEKEKISQMEKTIKQMTLSLNQAVEDNKVLREKVENIEANNKLLRSENDQLKQKNITQQQEITDLTNKVESYGNLNDQIEAAKQRNDELSQKWQELQDRLKNSGNEKDEKFAGLTAENERLNSQIIELESQLQEANHANSSLQSSLNSSSSSYQEIVGKYEEKIKLLTEKLVDVYAELNVLIEYPNRPMPQLFDYSDEVLNYKDTMPWIKVKKNENNKILVNNSTFRDSVKNEFKEKITNINKSNETEFNDFLGKFIEYFNLMVNFAKEVNVCMENKKKCDVTLGTLQDDNENLTKKINECNKNLANCKDLLAACNLSGDEKCKQISEINANLTKQINECNSKLSNLESIQSTYDNLKNNYDNLVKEYRKLKTNIHSNAAKFLLKDTKISNCEDKLAELLKSIKSLEINIDDIDPRPRESPMDNDMTFKRTQLINPLTRPVLGKQRLDDIQSQSDPDFGKMNEIIKLVGEIIKNLKKEKEGLSQANNDLSEKIKILEKNIQENATEVDKEKLDKIQLLEKQIEKQLSDIKNKDSWNASLFLENKALTSENADIQKTNRVLYKMNLEKLVDTASSLRNVYIDTKVAIQNMDDKIPQVVGQTKDEILKFDENDAVTKLIDGMIGNKNNKYTYKLPQEIETILTPVTAPAPDAGAAQSSSSAPSGSGDTAATAPADATAPTSPLSPDSIATLKTYTENVFAFIEKIIGELKTQLTQLNDKKQKIFDDISDKNTRSLDDINDEINKINNVLDPDTFVDSGDINSESIKAKIGELIKMIKNLNENLNLSKADLQKCNHDLTACQNPSTPTVTIPTNPTTNPAAPTIQKVNLADLISSISQNLPKIIKSTTPSTGLPNTVAPPIPNPPATQIIPLMTIEHTSSPQSLVSIKHSQNFIYDFDRNNIKEGIKQSYVHDGTTYHNIVTFYLTPNQDPTALIDITYQRQGDNGPTPLEQNSNNDMYDKHALKNVILNEYNKLYGNDTDGLRKVLENLYINYFSK